MALNNQQTIQRLNEICSANQASPEDISSEDLKFILERCQDIDKNPETIEIEEIARQTLSGLFQVKKPEASASLFKKILDKLTVGKINLNENFAYVLHSVIIKNNLFLNEDILNRLFKKAPEKDSLLKENALYLIAGCMENVAFRTQAHLDKLWTYKDHPDREFRRSALLPINKVLWNDSLATQENYNQALHFLEEKDPEIRVQAACLLPSFARLGSAPLEKAFSMLKDEDIGVAHEASLYMGGFVENNPANANPDFLKRVLKALDHPLDAVKCGLLETVEVLYHTQPDLFTGDTLTVLIGWTSKAKEGLFSELLQDVIEMITRDKPALLTEELKKEWKGV